MPKTTIGRLKKAKKQTVQPALLLGPEALEEARRKDVFVYTLPTPRGPPPCRKIKPPVLSQAGGYRKGSRLKKTASDSRFERSFTQVFLDEDGEQYTKGNYIGYDYTKKDKAGKYRMQGTSWLSAVKKAYRQNCGEFREAVRLGMIMEDFNIPDDDEDRAQEVWKGLSKEEQQPYRDAAIKTRCRPMVIVMRETTPGNNKKDFSFRERQYYIESIPAEPVKVTPSKGPTPRVYRFNPKVYPMKMGESVEQFKRRKGLE